MIFTDFNCGDGFIILHISANMINLLETSVTVQHSPVQNPLGLLISVRIKSQHLVMTFEVMSDPYSLSCPLSLQTLSPSSAVCTSLACSHGPGFSATCSRVVGFIFPRRSQFRPQLFSVVFSDHLPVFASLLLLHYVIFPLNSLILLTSI